VGVFGGPNVSEGGLVLALDGANYKSFKGEGTTNLIPSPTVNAYPTTGNGWGSYNTNQYNGAQYFSIGSIVSVSGNHPLRTYDVVNPQTTGGGVSAGVNYFIKKVSDTSFTLHAYNGSQDGSQGYISPSTGTHKVYDSIATDTRISVNSTSFPTMWWGAPHLPNSGLVKELRYGEFNAIPNLPANDCIRLHYIRTDDVKDGMAYNVDCTITPSSPVTVSFYTRAVNANAVGKQILYHIYNYSGGSPTGYYYYFTLGAVGVWERQTFTFTPANSAMISYWFPQSSGTYAWDWSCMQVEQKSYVTNFVAGTRGTTVATGGGWADLSANGNNGELLNGVRENSNNLGSLVFDGSNDYIQTPLTGTYTQISFDFWGFFDDATLSATSRNESAFGDWISNRVHFGTRWSVGMHFNVNGIWQTTPTTNLRYGWNHYVLVYDTVNNLKRVYLNNILSSSHATNGNMVLGDFRIGVATNLNQYYRGNISNFKVYNRALTAQEIQQNFNATRSRFSV
jgi:hypothetical protein